MICGTYLQISLNYLHILQQILSENDQKIPESQTAYKQTHVVAWVRCGT